MSSDFLVVRHEADRSIIQLRRAQKLNALTAEMLETLEKAIIEIDTRQSTRLVLLSSDSDRAFSVGADINEWSALEPFDMWRIWITRGHRIFDRLAGLRVPVIAVLNGYVFGGGLELALAADIRLASDKASFSAPEVKLGTVPGWAGTQRLPALIGSARAKQMIFSGERIDAQKAYEWGLVNEVIPSDHFDARVDELAASICANAPLAVQMTKQLIDAGDGLGTGLILESLASALTAYSADGKEGLSAFHEKRDAKFEGR